MNTTVTNHSNASLDYESGGNNFTFTDDFPEPYRSIRAVVNWATIGLVFLSIVGNALIITVMSRKQNRKSSTSFLFTCLAVSDMMLVINVPFERWVHWTFSVSLYGISPYITTAKTVLTYSNIQISALLLVCITVERVLSIAFPYRIKELCTKARAGTVIFILCFLIIGLNTFGFNFIVAVTFNDAYGVIWVRKVEKGETIIAWMDFAMSFLIPISFIVLGSSYIIVHLLCVKIQKHDAKNRRNRSVTLTLIAANIVFIVTMSPFVILHLIYPSVPERISIYLYWTLAEAFMFLSDMNAALNFFVYVLSGSRFRTDVKQLLGRQKSTIESSTNAPEGQLAHALRTVYAIAAFKRYSVSSNTEKTQTLAPTFRLK